MDVRKKPTASSQSDEQTQAGIAKLRYALSRLHTAPQHAAVIDCLFDLKPRRTNPIFEDLVLVDGRLIFAKAKNETSFRHFVGRREALVLNLLGFVQHLGLGTTEREFVLSRIDGMQRRTSR